MEYHTCTYMERKKKKSKCKRLGNSGDPKAIPDRSVGKETACNAGDPGLIPGSGRSLGEGKGYPLQYSGLENSMGSLVGYSP